MFNRKYKRVVVCVLFACVSGCCLMIKKECEHDEVHKSCSFYEEYTCWETEMLTKRVKVAPKRLAHCRAGCYCKNGMVRAHPNGKCIMALACRDLELQAILKKVPADFSNMK